MSGVLRAELEHKIRLALDRMSANEIESLSTNRSRLALVNDRIVSVRDD